MNQQGWQANQPGAPQWQPQPQHQWAPPAAPSPKRNWFVRHKVWTGVIVAVVLIMIISVASGGSKSNNKTTTPAATTAPAKPAAAPAPPVATAPKPAPSPAPAPVRQVHGTLITVGAGNYTIGTPGAPVAGLYDVTTDPGQSGNFIVQGPDQYDEILGTVPKVRAQLSQGDTIQLGSLSSVTFTPVATPFVVTQGPVTLYAGTWTVGQDLGRGRYVAAPGAGQSGNFIIESEFVDEILGSGGVPNVNFNVKDGDIINISGMSSVTLTPA